MEIDEDVLEMVRRQLDRDPPPSTAALYGRAARINSDIYDLSLRQFHAKYPLRVKREQARRERDAARSGAGPSDGAGAGRDDGEAAPVPDDAGRRHLFGGEAADAAPGGDDGRRSGTADGAGARDAAGAAEPEETRERIRGVFLRLAREVAEADRPELLVDVVESLPDRVEEIARIVSSRPTGA